MIVVIATAPSSTDAKLAATSAHGVVNGFVSMNLTRTIFAWTVRKRKLRKTRKETRSE